MISTVGAFLFAAGIAAVPDRPGPQPASQSFRSGGQYMESRHAGVAAQRCLRSAQHPDRDERRSAMGSAAPCRRCRGRTVLSARFDHRPARDDRHLADRGCAAISAAPSRPRLDAIAGGDLHRGLLHAADGQGRHPGADLRRARGGDGPGLDVGQRSGTAQGGGYRRRHQASDLCIRLAVAFLVGDDRAAAGRRLALSRLCVFLSLSLDGLAAILAETGDARADRLAGLVSLSACCRQRCPRRGRTSFAPQAAKQSPLRRC